MFRSSLSASPVTFRAAALALATLATTLQAQSTPPRRPPATPVTPYTETAGGRLAPFDSLAFSGVRWREIGPYRGGRSVAVTGSPMRPNEYWMGTTGGGVFKSINAGQSWAPVTDKYFGGTIGAIAVAPSNPDIVYVGGGEYPHPRQRLARRRRVEDHRRRQDLDVLGLKETQQIARHRRASDQSRSRVRRRARTRVGAERRSAASSARRTAEDAGRRSSSATTPPASSTW